MEREKKSYGDGEGCEGGNGGVDNVFAAAHDSNGGSVFAQLDRHVEPDARPATRQQSYLAFHYIALERSFHFSLRCYTSWIFIVAT